MVTPVKIHRRQKETTSHIGKMGKIVVWTMIRVSTKLFNKQAPYPIVIVKFQDGDQAMGQLVDWTDADLRPGLDVTAVLRRTGIEDAEGIISYSIKFRPL